MQYSRSPIFFKGQTRRIGQECRDFEKEDSLSLAKESDFADLFWFIHAQTVLTVSIKDADCVSQLRLSYTTRDMPYP